VKKTFRLFPPQAARWADASRSIMIGEENWCVSNKFHRDFIRPLLPSGEDAPSLLRHTAISAMSRCNNKFHRVLGDAVDANALQRFGGFVELQARPQAPKPPSPQAPKPPAASSSRRERAGK